MPTYEYACPDCGNRFEIKQKFTDDPLKRCPNCQRRHVYRVVSQVAVTFKGSGWYITDSKSSGDKHTISHKQKEDHGESAEAKPESKTDAKTDTKTESTGEGKPETKVEAKPETKTAESPKHDERASKAKKQ